jgi:hypothetical protein
VPYPAVLHDGQLLADKKKKHTRFDFFLLTSEGVFASYLFHSVGL